MSKGDLRSSGSMAERGTVLSSIMLLLRGYPRAKQKCLLAGITVLFGGIVLVVRDSRIGMSVDKSEIVSEFVTAKSNASINFKSERRSLDIQPAPDGVAKETLFYHVNIDYERNLSAEGGPTDYLPSYQNPCWMSSYPNPKPGENPYKRSPYIVDWIKRYIWGKEWYPYFESFMKDMTARISRGENWRVRCTPGVYLIGSSKSGTDDLYFKMINYHPDIHKPAVKEPLWWIHGRFGGTSFYNYLDGFDRSAEMMRRKKVIKDGREFHPGYAIDASSWYIYSYDNWKSIPGNKGLSEPKYVLAHALKALYPGTKIMAILREPATRLYSQYRMKFTTNAPEHFDRLVRSEVDAMKKCIRDKGLRRCVYEPRDGREMATGIFLRGSLYYPFLRDWVDVFGLGQIMVVRAEDYYADRVSTLQKVFTFLNLDPLNDESIRKVKESDISNTGTSWKRSSRAMLNSTKQYLDDFFSPFDKQLAELFKDKGFLWEGY